jgi:hypothetical protein
MALLVIAVGAGALAALVGTWRLWCGAGLLLCRLCSRRADAITPGY